MKKVIIAVFCLFAAAMLVGCVPAEDALKGNDTSSTAEDISGAEQTEEAGTSFTVMSDEEIEKSISDFSVELLKNSVKAENVLVSPLSSYYALAMTQNGAAGETETQMESVLGADAPSLNAYLNKYMDALDEKEAEAHMANSLWIKEDERLTVDPVFQNNVLKAYYDTDIFTSAFDAAAVSDINAWVADNTDGRITDMLSEIPDETVMYIISALAFEADWQTPYSEMQVMDGVFTKEDGTEIPVQMMTSEESFYINDENAEGFIKLYSGGYAFAALLPKEGMRVDEYIAALSGEKLSETLRNAEELTVYASLPKFSKEYESDMSEALKSMGLTDAFDADRADFSSLGSYDGGNIYVNSVKQKIFINVDEKGTEAGAATVVDMAAKTALLPEESKTVTLDRPFLYMVIDTENYLPLFMGTLDSAEQQ